MMVSHHVLKSRRGYAGKERMVRCWKAIPESRSQAVLEDGVAGLAF
jgi:hypothetical protein